MGLVMVASLVQSVTRNPLYALIGVGLGVAIATWGALTRVRRRLLGGVIAVVASLLLLVVGPLVPVVSEQVATHVPPPLAGLSGSADPRLIALRRNVVTAAIPVRAPR